MVAINRDAMNVQDIKRYALTLKRGKCLAISEWLASIFRVF